MLVRLDVFGPWPKEFAREDPLVFAVVFICAAGILWLLGTFAIDAVVWLRQKAIERRAIRAGRRG